MDKYNRYIEKTGTCWIWKGEVSKNGYGKVKEAKRTTGAHRAIYKLYYGAIAPQLEIDHICRVRNCVNPEHLEAVSHKENMVRAAPFKVKDTCKFGHVFNKQNTCIRIFKDKKWQVCRTCRNRRQRGYKKSR